MADCRNCQYFASFIDGVSCQSMPPHPISLNNLRSSKECPDYKALRGDRVMVTNYSKDAVLERNAESCVPDSFFERVGKIQCIGVSKYYDYQPYFDDPLDWRSSSLFQNHPPRINCSSRINSTYYYCIENLLAEDAYLSRLSRRCHPYYEYEFWLFQEEHKIALQLIVDVELSNLYDSLHQSPYTIQGRADIEIFQELGQIQFYKARMASPKLEIDFEDILITKIIGE